MHKPLCVGSAEKKEKEWIFGYFDQVMGRSDLM